MFQTLTIVENWLKYFPFTSGLVIPFNFYEFLNIATVLLTNLLVSFSQCFSRNIMSVYLREIMLLDLKLIAQLLYHKYLHQMHQKNH